jgi:hypothetical protein
MVLTIGQQKDGLYVAAQEVGGKWESATGVSASAALSALLIDEDDPLEGLL